MLNFLEAKLNTKHCTRYIMLLSIVLISPSLFIGFITDDFHIMSAVSDTPIKPQFPVDNSLFQAFSASDGTVAARDTMVSNGLMPWWSSDSFTFKMYRPLAEFTHWLDYQLWKNLPFFMHLQNLMWWLVILLTVSSLYKRYFSFSPQQAPFWISLSFLLFALDANLAETLIWIAGRNTLMGACFGLLSLRFYETFMANKPVQDQWSHYALSIIFFALGLFSTELALSAGAYIFAYAIFMARQPLMLRAFSLVPFGIIFIGWAMIYITGGHGVDGSHKYISPVSSPDLFLKTFIERSPAMLFQNTTKLPIGSILGSSTLFSLAWSVSIVALALLLYVAREFLSTNRGKFLLLGASLSLLPIAATGDARVLIFVNFGFAPIVAWALKATIFSPVKTSNTAANRTNSKREKIKHTVTRTTFASVFYLTMFLSLLIPGAAALGYTNQYTSMTKPALSLPVYDTQHTVMLINPLVASLTAFYPAIRQVHQLPAPKAQFALASGIQKIQLSRESGNTITLTAETSLLAGNMELFTRDRNSTFQIGDTFQYNNMVIRVVELSEKQLPKKISLSFSSNLDQLPIQWVACIGNQWSNVQLPMINDSINFKPCGMSILAKE